MSEDQGTFLLGMAVLAAGVVTVIWAYITSNGYRITSGLLACAAGLTIAGALWPATIVMTFTFTRYYYLNANK